MWGRMTQNKPGAFPYPCSDDSRTDCLLRTNITFGVFAGMKVLGNVWPYQTVCSRIAGHWDMGKAPGLFCVILHLHFGGGREKGRIAAGVFWQSF